MTRNKKGSLQIPLPYVNAKSNDDNEALAAEVISAITRAGACVVRNMFDTTTTEKVIEDIRPHLADAGNYIGQPPCLPVSYIVTGRS
jgi:hypothetical protein